MLEPPALRHICSCRHRALWRPSPTLRAQTIAKTARLIVGFPRGRHPSMSWRTAAGRADEGLRASMIVDNRPGAGGRIALEALKGASRRSAWCSRRATRSRSSRTSTRIQLQAAQGFRSGHHGLRRPVPADGRTDGAG